MLRAGPGHTHAHACTPFHTRTNTPHTHTQRGDACFAANERALEVLRAGLDRRAFTAVELQNVKKSGQPFPNLLCVVPVTDSVDTLLKFVGVSGRAGVWVWVC